MNDVNNKDMDADQELLEIEVERRRRLRIIMAVVPGFFGLLLFIALISLDPEYWWQNWLFNDKFFWMIDISLLGFSMITTIMIYLQTGFKKNISEEAKELRHSKELLKIREQLELSKKELPNKKSIDEKLQSLEAAIENIPAQRAELSEEERSEFISSIKRSLESEAADEVIAAIEKQAKIHYERDTHIADLKERFEICTDRLRSEISSLSYRGNLNLAIGVTATILGLALLGYVVFGGENNFNEMWPFLSHFIPRITLVLFIELFAYFFLRLYKSSLTEIKYFQNEITNIESKYIAALATDKNNAEGSNAVNPGRIDSPR